jgi:thiol:disulfide interchange protein DsbC
MPVWRSPHWLATAPEVEEMQAKRWFIAWAATSCATLSALAADNPQPTGTTGIKPVATTEPALKSVPISAEISSKVRAALKERVPQLTVLDVRGSEIPGLYEVMAPDGVTYTDITANYVLMGPLIDTRSHRNVSQDRWTTFNRVDYASLPFNLAIKSVRGKGTRQMAVFADPKCPFCQQLEERIDKMDDITVYTFLYPLEEVHPGATTQAHQIWCSSDREATWNNWMRKHETPAPAAEGCTTDPVKDLAALGNRLHIITTPTIIFPSGERSPGLPPPQQLDRLLATQSAADAAVPTPNSAPNS